MDTVLLTHPRTQRQLEQYLAAPAHALGLHGEAGAGKGYAASYLAASLLGVTAASLEKHPYVLRLDVEAQKAGIDDIRQLQTFLTLTVPGSGAVKRVVIVEHFDGLGHEAQNAILKTLEEPPADTVIVVTYARDTNLLPTIHSRLQSIQVLPVGQPQARQYFSEYDEAAFNRSYLISGGLAGLLTALLEDQSDHPLLKAIEQAREIIGLNRFQRLSKVDKLIKNNDLPANSLLDGLYRLLHAGYQQSVKIKSNAELKTTVARLGLIEEAIDDLDQNVQAKLVLSRLFTEL